LAVGVIFCCTAVAWFTLGASVVSRTGQSDQRLAQEVAQLWGGRHQQVAPTVSVERPREVVEDVQEKDAAGRVVTRRVTRRVAERTPLTLEGSQVEVDLSLDHRRKGLLWYDTYSVRFQATYRARNPDAVARPLVVQLAFPSTQALYDDFAFTLDGAPAPPGADLSHGIVARTEVGPGGEAVVELRYRSRGLGEWLYAFAPEGVAQARAFALSMKTDFRDIDFPPGTLSPSARTALGRGWKLDWRFDNLVTGQRIGMDPPNRLNPGPLASRITFFAPVSLLFFFTVVLVVGVLRGQSLHPMNYFFLAAAFFAFHLLLAYLVDHVDIHVAFLIASAASIFLVVSYLRLVAGPRFALLHAGLAQLVYLVLFSYAFFFEGYTGLTVTVGAVLTLFVLMQITAKVDWGMIFARRPAPPA
jgi:hypothetical protein